MYLNTLKGYFCFIRKWTDYITLAKLPTFYKLTNAGDLLSAFKLNLTKYIKGHDIVSKKMRKLFSILWANTCFGTIKQKTSQLTRYPLSGCFVRQSSEEYFFFNYKSVLFKISGLSYNMEKMLLF